MKTVQMLGNQQVRVIDVPEPEPKDERVVVKIMSSALCGSERHTYHGPNTVDGPRYNGGHEGTGIVCKVDRSSVVREGDRVALYAGTPCGQCRYCLAGHWVLCERRDSAPQRFPGNHSQYVAVGDRACLPLADDVSFEIGSLLGDVLGTPFRAIKRLKVTAFDTVLITGQGPIGLSALLLCKFLNAFVIVLDINEYRLNHARKCGADVCVNPAEETDVLARLQEAAGAEGIDVALDCSANPDAQTLCLDALRRGGRMAFIGVTDQGPRINTIEHFTKKELELIGTWYSRPGDHRELEALVRRGLQASELITHSFGIEAAPEAFDTFFGGAAMKVMLDPWD